MVSASSLEEQINNLLTLEKEIITLREYINKPRYILGIRDKHSKLAFLNILEDNVRESIKEVKAGNIFKVEKLSREHQVLMDTEFPSIFNEKDDGFILVSKVFISILVLTTVSALSFITAILILL